MSSKMEASSASSTEAESGNTYKAGLFCAIQGTSSVSLMILNKYLATYFHFPIMTLITQNVMATILSIAVWACGVGPTMKPWKKSHFIKVIPMSALFTVLLYTSFRTMGYLSIATVVVFRNAGPLLTAVGENHIRKEQFTNNSLVALGMMIVGGLIYGMNDLQFDVTGYMWATFNLVINTAAGLFGKQLAMDLKSEQTGMGLSCYQNIVSVPMFLFVGVATGEYSRWADSSAQSIPLTVYVAGGISCCACVSMGLSTFELQRVVSQATVAVANVSYKLITLLVGALVFGNNVGLAGFVGLMVAQASAVLYVYDRQFGAGNGKAAPSEPATRQESVPLTSTEASKADNAV